MVFRITGYIIESKPKLTIFPIFLNLGAVKQGEKCRGIIELKNWGDKEIKIIKVDGSSKLIISPQERLESVKKQRLM